MKKLAMLSVLLVASACVAGTATLSLEVDSAAKTYQVYATTEGVGNLGLDTFNFYVNFGGGLASTLIDNPDYLPFDPNSQEFIPDGILRAPATADTGFFTFLIDGDMTDLGVNFAASQNSVYGPSYNGTLNNKVIKNVGIGSPVLLASGSFTGDAGTISLFVPTTPSNGLPQILFLKDTYAGAWYGPGNLEQVTSVALMGVLDGGDAVAGPITLVPEPTTIGLLCLGLIGLIRRK